MIRIPLLVTITLMLAGCSGVPTGRTSPCANPGRADGSYAVADSAQVVSRNATGCLFHDL